MNRDLKGNRLSPGWQVNLAQVYGRTGEMDRAIKLIEAAYSTDSNLKDGYARLGWIKATVRDWEGAFDLMNRDIKMNQLLRTNIDGIPLDITRKLLPYKTRFNINLLTHIHLHAKSQKRFADKALGDRFSDVKVDKRALIGLIESLISTISHLKIKTIGTEWENYYQDTNYSENAFSAKKEIISKFMSRSKPHFVWDLGANNGEFSRIASERGIKTIAFDIDHGAVEKNYRHMRENQEENTNNIPDFS